MEATNASLSARLVEEAERQKRLSTALNTLEETRAVLPAFRAGYANTANALDSSRICRSCAMSAWLSRAL